MMGIKVGVLHFEVGESTSSQRMQEACRSWEGKVMDTYLDTPELTQPS